MDEDVERTRRVRQEIASAGIDALLCQENANVLLLTGYAPVLGLSFVVFPAQGEPTLIVPETELSLARESWCRDVRGYDAGVSDGDATLFSVVGPILATVAAERGWEASDFGFEGRVESLPAGYSQVGFPSWGTYEMYRRALPRARFVDLAPVLEVLRATKTSREIDRIRSAVEAAALGFLAARERIQVGAHESTVAAATQSAIQATGREKGARHLEVFAHVMSGARSEYACYPFNLTTTRRLQAGDPVVVQVEVAADGFWVGLTRTFFVGDPGAEGRRIYEACHQAYRLASEALHDGAAASDFDAAARTYLAGDGFGPSFRHGTGHGVGFEAATSRQPPRLTPGSTDTILTGMVVAITPGVYVHGWGGVRIADPLVVCAQEAVALAHLPRELGWAMVPQRSRAGHL